MSYRNKTYVCFDADNDMNYYNLMKAWKENGKIAFNFHNAHEINNLRDGSSEQTIKNKLRERLQNTKVIVILIGEHTKNLYKYVRWEMEYAVEKDIPIIAVNLNGKKDLDASKCPPIIKDKLSIHIPFGQRIINYALNNWPQSHEKHISEGETGPFKYKESVYEGLDL